MPPQTERRRYVEVDGAGNITHVATIELPGDQFVVTVRDDETGEDVVVVELPQELVAAEADRRIDGASLSSPAPTFVRLDPAAPEPQARFHKFDRSTGRFVKKTRDEVYGPPPNPGQDLRPPATAIPDPPPASAIKKIG